MGKVADCAMRRAGRTIHGTALLETDELVFRSKDERIKLPLGGLKVAVDADALVVRHAGGSFALALGAEEAAKWERAITHPKSRADKLGVKPGARASLVGVTDASLARELEARGVDVSTRLRKETDVVFVQIDAPAGLARFEDLARRIARDGAVWAITPRGVAGLKDTDVMAAAKRAGLVDVKVVRFSETHSANKFVIPAAKR